MHGIQHLFRQHALEKQSSTESWHSAYAGGGGSTQGSLSSQGNFAFSRPPNERSHSVDEAGSTYDSSGGELEGIIGMFYFFVESDMFFASSFPPGMERRRWQTLDS